ncbi:GNAT family N-acetyltransferase [Natronomonas sp. EA1]|uniref:GNAT family N-acetyltransferase n=1 Tax=Natronomonas sp. EA1 TaxID=3421655 RepID=UPI003EBE8471
MNVVRIEDDDELAAAFAIRRAVFIEEQEVPEELELDEKDETATHVLATVDGEPVGTARLIDYDGVGKVQRVAVRRAHRGTGVGEALMAKVEALAREEGYDELVLDAQVPVIGFYETLGYEVRDDEPFLDAGIPHKRMGKVL